MIHFSTEPDVFINPRFIESAAFSVVPGESCQILIRMTTGIEYTITKEWYNDHALRGQFANIIQDIERAK